MSGPHIARRPMVALIATGVLGVGAAAYGVVAVAAAQKQTLHAAPNGKLRFDKGRLTARPGALTLVLVNPRNSGLSHGIGIQGRGLDKDGRIVRPGRTSQVTATVKKGTYTYYCPVPGHRAAGMRGTLTVR